MRGEEGGARMRCFYLRCGCGYSTLLAHERTRHVRLICAPINSSDVIRLLFGCYSVFIRFVLIALCLHCLSMYPRARPF